MIEIDPDAGPLYATYEVPMCDNGEVAREALASTERGGEGRNERS